MADTYNWPEVESQVYRPNLWLTLSVGTFFLAAGIIGVFTIERAVPPGGWVWVARLCAAVFGLLGGIPVAWVLSSIISPAHIRHAASSVMANVPKEPVTHEGSVVYGRLTHELIEDGVEWRYQPDQRLWRDNKRFLIGFGIPFMTFASGLLTWVFHSELKLGGWFLSALLGTAATVVSGCTPFLLIGMLMRSSYRRLCQLTIPRNGGDLELDSPEEPNPDNEDLAEGLKWVFLGGTKRRRLTIPRETVAAARLCPWKFVLGEHRNNLGGPRRAGSDLLGGRHPLSVADPIDQ